MTDAALRDADVVDMIATGATRRAFDALVQRYETKVFHLCVAMLGDNAHAEEAAQESLLRVWRALDGYDATRGALSTWVFAITRNRCLTALGDLGRARGVEVSMELPDVGAQAELLAQPQPVNDAASLDLLRGLVEGLTPTHRTCLKLFYFEDQSVQEVADRLELPAGTVKTHLHRARAALHRALQARGLADASLWV
jgi:RNA polymerase sigma-70 factor (ECF subfamily)